MQRTLAALQRFGTRPHGALGKIALSHSRQALEVVVAGVAEVGGAEAEVDSH